MQTGDRAEYERICLNAMEERVLPPDVRLKMVFAQANASESEEEELEADVSSGSCTLPDGGCGGVGVGGGWPMTP